jgi:negative regulator of flagellin synthesis FlgM
MTDPISNLGRSASQPNLANEKVKHSKTDAIPTQADKVVPPKNDEVVLSGASESALANAEFNAEKVAKIKAAIEQGNYPIDARKVAESFASLERMIGGE